MNPITVDIKERLPLGNRDGDLFLVAAAGAYYLVLEAQTYWNREMFGGMGSTGHIEIPQSAYMALLRCRV